MIYCTKGQKDINAFNWTDFLVGRLFLFISFMNFFIFNSLYLLVSSLESQNRGTRMTQKKVLIKGRRTENMPNSALTSGLARI